MELRPTTGHERLEVLDALRGLALFGILLANLYSFLGYSTYTPTEITLLPLADRAVLFLIDWFVEGKFYSIFSMLFGIGFALQLERMKGKEAFFQAYWLRRMGILLCFGLTHMLFVWNGDILTLYSLLGMVLLPIAVLSTPGLMRMAGLLLAIPIVLHVIVTVTQEAAFWRYSSEAIKGWQAALGYADHTLLEMRTSDTPVDVFFINIIKAAARPMSYLQTGRIPQVLGLFIMGILIVRVWGTHLRSGLCIPRKYWLLPGLFGLVSSFGYAIIKGMIGTPYALTDTGMLQAVLYHVGAPTLAVGIAGGLYHYWNKTNTRKRLAGLVSLGRMALTNYIMQNIIAVLVFFGHGLGLMRQIPFAAIPLIAGLILFLQWRFAHFWLSRYKQGPLEMVWKKLSYSG